MKKKILFILIAALIAVPAFSAGKKEDPAAVRVGVFKGPTGFGIINVMDNPPEAGEGISFDFEVLPGPADMVARVATGEVDIALFPVNMAAKMYTKGPKYRLAAIVGNGLLYCISRDETIKSITDLDGKKIYSVGQGATPDYLFRFLAEKAGIDAKADFSFNAPTQLVPLYLSGKADTVILPEPFAALVLAKSTGRDATRVVVDFQKEWMSVTGSDSAYPISALVVSPSFADTHPKTLKAFLAAYRESIAWVNANPGEAAQLIEKYDIFPAAMAEAAIPGCNLVYVSADEAKAEVESFLKVLLDSDPDSIGGELPDEDFYKTF